MPTIKLIESLALASNGKLKKNLLLWFAGYTLPKSLVQNMIEMENFKHVSNT